MITKKKKDKMQWSYEEILSMHTPYNITNGYALKLKLSKIMVAGMSGWEADSMLWTSWAE